MCFFYVDKLQALENICKEQVFDQVKAYYRQFADKKDTKAEQPAAPKQDAGAAGAEAVDVPMQDDGPVDDPLSAWEGEPLKECADLAYVLTVSNTTELPLKFRISFKEGCASESSDLLWPRQGLLGKIGPNEVGKVVAVLPRKNPA